MRAESLVGLRYADLIDKMPFGFYQWKMVVVTVVFESDKI